MKTQQSAVILDLSLRKTRSGNSHDHRVVIVFKKHRFQNVFRPHENKKPVFSNSSGLKSVFEKSRFRDGAVWTVRQPRSQGFSLEGGWEPPWERGWERGWTARLTVEIKQPRSQGLSSYRPLERAKRGR